MAKPSITIGYTTVVKYLPRLERVLDRSMMVCLLGLLRTERLAREMSAVTLVIDILQPHIRELVGGWSGSEAGISSTAVHKIQNSKFFFCHILVQDVR